MTGWLPRICTSIVSDHSPPVEGWQAKLDGVVASYLHKYSAGPSPSCGGEMSSTDTLGAIASRLYPVTQPDGVVVEVLHNVTPFVLLQQTAVLSDGVVASYLYNLP